MSLRRTHQPTDLTTPCFHRWHQTQHQNLPTDQPTSLRLKSLGPDLDTFPTDNHFGPPDHPNPVEPTPPSNGSIHNTEHHQTRRHSRATSKSSSLPPPPSRSGFFFYFLIFFTLRYYTTAVTTAALFADLNSTMPAATTATFIVNTLFSTTRCSSAPTSTFLSRAYIVFSTPWGG